MAQPEHDEHDTQRDQAVRDAVACPECTAGRSELCRDRDGAEVATHASRIEVYGRDHAAVDDEPQSEPDDERTPALGRVSARARGTVTRKTGTDTERESGQEEGDRG